jgi:hypothetical protein
VRKLRDGGEEFARVGILGLVKNFWMILTKLVF